VTEKRADRELLFEALAIHLGFLPPNAASVRADPRPFESALPGSDSLGGRLVADGLLTVDQSELLEALVARLLARHNGDVGRCLDALSSFGRLRTELAKARGGKPSGHPTVSSIAIAGEKSQPSSESEIPIDDVTFDHDALDDNGEHVHDALDDSGEHVAAELAEPAPVAMPLGSLTSASKRFQVIRPHAQGGIGKVSVAFDAELHREVALKQIKPERADDAESRARFLREAEVTGRLEHPGVVPVYGLGVDESGRPYYAMRFVRGSSFEEAIKRFHQEDADPARSPRARSLELRQLLDRFVAVCQTIAYAHSRGVLHRDLKPANILLGPFKESLVVDWGLAKVLAQTQEPWESRLVAEEPPRQDDEGEHHAIPMPDRDAEPDVEHAAASKKRDKRASGNGEPPIGVSSSTETATGIAFGTPAFMSPEQAEGRIDQIGTPTDVYSLGAMLYTLLCGHPPFEYVWCNLTSLLESVRQGEFQPPHKVNPRVPRALEAVCLKAMARRPQDRYASAADLATEIERWLADEPVLAYPEPAVARLARWGRRHKPIVAGAAALLVSVVAGLSGTVVLLDQEQRKTEAQRRFAEEQRVLAMAKSAEATAKAESLRRREAISLVNLASREYLDDNVALADKLLENCPTDLREWEWAYARRLGHSELKTFVPSSLGQDVWCVAFSPDGTLIAAGTGPWFQVGDGPTAEVAVRSIKTGTEILAVRRLIGAFQAVAFSPDGRQLAVARGFTGNAPGAELSVFDVHSGRRVWQAAEKGVQILSLSFSPDGQTIATGCGGFNNYSDPGFVRLRSASSGNALGAPIPGGPGGVLSVAFSPDGRQLAASSREIVEIRDASSPGLPLVHQLRKHSNFVYAVAFSPDGQRVATGGWDKTIWLWDCKSGAPLQALIGHRGFVRGLAFSPDSTQLVSGSEDKSVRRWDLTGTGENGAFHGHTGFVHCVAFSPDGVLCASGSLDGTVKLWPIDAPDSQVTFRNSRGWVGTVAFSPDSRRVASAHDGNVRVWDPRTGEEFHRIPGPRGLLGRVGLAFSPDGSILAASGTEATVNLWDTSSWTIRGILRGHPAQVVDADFSRDGTRLAVACENGTIQVWDRPRSKSLWSKMGHAGGANAVTFAPNNRSIATGGEDRTIRIWDVNDGQELASFSGHATGVRDVAFSPDGGAIASTGGAYHGPTAAELKIWDLSSRNPAANLQGHTGLVTAVVFFPNGRRIATASDDRTIKIWDVPTREEVFTLRGHTSGVVSLAISPNGQQLVSGSIDYTAKTWSAETYTEDVAFDISRRRAAIERVGSLFSQYLLKADVLGALRANAKLSPPIRAASLEIAERRVENASGLYEAAWLTIVHPTGSIEANRQAQRQLEAACRVVAGDTDRLASYRRALALAYYRTDQAAQAIKTISSLKSPAAGPLSGQAAEPVPLDLAVVAMARCRLGQTADAQAALVRLRKLLQDEHWAHDREAQGLLKEAEEIARGQKSAR
jgi:WD40 repeat protein/serine/threonine protein kinase